MHSFEQRALDILETARIGGSDNLTLTCTPEGGLHLVMGEGSAIAARNVPMAPANSATYHVVRKGKAVFVTGRAGDRRCSLESATGPLLPPLLLNNQALYRLTAAQVLPPCSEFAL